MTTYNTGNPIGSTAVKDLYDNAENLDTAVNSRTAESWGDRFGVARKTWWGMEQDFQQFLINSGYENIGDYAAGLEITARNQIFWRDGEMYRAGAELELPYTTTGDWGDEEGLFVVVGDAALRQALADSESPESGASMIAYRVPAAGAVGETVQKKLNRMPVTPQEFGAIGDGVTDDTEAFQRASLYAKEIGGVLLAPNAEGYFLSDSVEIFTDAEIMAPLIFPADGVFRYFRIKSEAQGENIPFESLSGLTENSSRIGGLSAEHAGKFLRIASDEVLTERNNPPSNAPYTKNETVFILNASGDIVPSLSATFSTGHNTTVTALPIEPRIVVNLKGGIKLSGSGLGHASIVVDRSYVDIYLGPVSGESSEIRMALSINGNDCRIFDADLNGGEYSGYGYGISIGNTCKTLIQGVKGALSRTELDGRHGSLVTVRDCFLKTAGSHWGNGYVFENCHIGTISFSGKDLEVYGGSLTGISLRADVSLCAGRLIVKDVTWIKGASESFIAPPAAAISGLYSSPRRYFDYIEILNLRTSTANNVTLFGGGPVSNYAATFAIPRKIKISGIVAPNCKLLFPFRLPLDNARAWNQSSDYIVEDVNLHPDGVMELSQRPYNVTSPAAIRFLLRRCGAVSLAAAANSIESLDVEDCRVVGIGRGLDSAARGRIVLRGGSYEPESPSFTESPKGLINVELVGNVTMGQGTDGPVDFQIGCYARTGSTGYKTPLNYYVNPNVYETT